MHAGLVSLLDMSAGAISRIEEDIMDAWAWGRRKMTPTPAGDILTFWRIRLALDKLRTA
jgi:hypothetical protein